MPLIATLTIYEVAMRRFLLVLFLVLILTGQVFGLGDSLLFFERGVIYRLGAVYDATTFPDSVLDFFINQSCYDVVNYIGAQTKCVVKQDSITLVSAIVQYSLNSDHFRGLTAHLLAYNRQALDYEPLSDWGKKSLSGNVTRVTFVDEIQKVVVDPKPTGGVEDILLIFYNAYPNYLSHDTVNSTIPKEWSNVIMDKATVYCLERVENEWASYFNVDWDTEMKRLIITYAQPPYNVIVAPQIIKRP